MKKINYIAQRVSSRVKSNNKEDIGYSEILSLIYQEHFNYSIVDEDWVNKDRIFCDNQKAFEAVNDIYDYNENSYYDLSLGSLVGLALGRNKINNLIKTENKKSNLLNYTGFLVVNYSKIIEGDFLQTVLHAKGKKIDKLVIVALKKNDEKIESMLDFYEDNDFIVTETSINKVRQVSQALRAGKKSKGISLIIVNIPSKYDLAEQGTEPFDYKLEAKDRCSEVYKKWMVEYDKVISDKNQKILDILNYLKNPKINIDLETIEFKLDKNYENLITKSSEKIFDILEDKCQYVNLINNDNELLGISLCMGLSIAGIKPNYKITDIEQATSLIDKCNKYNLAVNFIIEQTKKPLDIKDLNVYYPCDMHEVIGSWSSIIKQNKTSVLMLSNEEATLIKNTNIKYVKYGGYMIKKEKEVLNGVISANKEDLNLALAVAGLLEKEGLQFRVVTIPCPNLLLNQVKYEKDLLPSCVKNFVIDQSDSLIAYKFATTKECVIDPKLGLDKIKEKIKSLLIG